MRALMIFALAGLALGGCKKKDTETAAAAEVEPAPMDPSKTILVSVKGPHQFKNVQAQCKGLTDNPKGQLVNREATVTGLQGECTLLFMPGGATFGPVTGGTSWNCIAQEDGDVGCKPM